MRHETDTRTGGFALIAVMVALAILLALVTPFLAGVFNEADSSSKIVAQRATDHRNQGQRDALLYLASQTDQGIDTTPFSDSKREFPSRLDVPAAFKAKGPRKYSSLSSGEVWDLQGRININTASPQLRLAVHGPIHITGQLTGGNQRGPTVTSVDRESVKSGFSVYGTEG